MADELDFLDTHVARGLRSSERRHWGERARAEVSANSVQPCLSTSSGAETGATKPFQAFTEILPNRHLSLMTDPVRAA